MNLIIDIDKKKTLFRNYHNILTHWLFFVLCKNFLENKEAENVVFGDHPEINAH